MGDVPGLYRRFGVKLPPLGDGWASTRCFTGRHTDRHPSARIHLRSGGFRCFACGEKGGVLHALELLGVVDRQEAKRLAVDYGILDPPKRRPPPQPTPAAPAPVPRSPSPPERVDYDHLGAATVVFDRDWVYVNHDNVPVGRIRRLDLATGEKRIWQERPDGDSWQVGLNGAQLPLYQLPEVLERAKQGERILIVEGEKAVDALARVGFFATTNAGGAGKWRPEHTAALNGATVLAVTDCDRPGRHHAFTVTADLIEKGVNALIPYDPAPLRQDGFDIVDELAHVAEATQAVTPTTGIRDKLHHYLRRQLVHQLKATPETLQRWYEHTIYLAEPAGRAYVTCAGCGQERVHRVAYGLAFCPCGAHQPKPT